MKRKYKDIHTAIKEGKLLNGITENVGICALYDIEKIDFILSFK